MDTIKPPVIIGAIIVGVAGFIGYNMMYLPKQQQIEQIQGLIAQEKQTQQAQAEVAALIKDFEDLRRRLPPEPDPSWITRQVLDLAKDAGIQVENISQVAPQTFQGFTHFAIDLKVTAGYHALGAFLDALERSDVFFRVEKITMKPDAGSDGPLDVALILGTVYAQPAGI
jgi:Tfp pilus assembly protein PilO